jgi:hypothetical protein
MEENVIVDDFEPVMLFVCSHGKYADELTIILKGHLIVEYMLDAIIKEKFKNPKKILGYSFFRKLEILFSLGLLPDYLFRNIVTLNNIRNNYAHDLTYSVNINELPVMGIDNRQLPKSPKLKRYSLKSNVRSFCVLVIMQLRNYSLEKLSINPKIE